MNNQEALIAGVQSWLDANRDIVLETVKKGAEEAIASVSEIIGVQISARAGRWFNENTQDLISAMALQFAINRLEDDPRLLRLIEKELQQREKILQSAAEEQNKAESESDEKAPEQEEKSGPVGE